MGTKENRIINSYLWSPSGQELLIHFKTLIDQYGGRLKTAISLEKEWHESKNRRIKRSIPKEIRTIKPWEKSEVTFIINNWHLMKDSEIAVYPNRTIYSTRERIKRMKKQGLLVPKVWSSMGNRRHKDYQIFG